MGNIGKENGHSPRTDVIKPNQRAAFSAMVQVVQEIDPRLAEKVSTLVATNLAYSNNGSGTPENLASAQTVYKKFGELYGLTAEPIRPPAEKKPRILKKLTPVGNIRIPGNCFKCGDRTCEHYDTQTTREERKNHPCTTKIIFPEGEVTLLSRPKRRIIRPHVNSTLSGKPVLYGPLGVDAKEYFGTRTNGSTEKKDN